MILFSEICFDYPYKIAMLTQPFGFIICFCFIIALVSKPVFLTTKHSSNHFYPPSSLLCIAMPSYLPNQEESICQDFSSTDCGLQKTRVPSNTV